MFHYVKGVPFDMTNNSGVFDRLTLWEQIDSGAQYTPAKKWLTTLPIVLYVCKCSLRLVRALIFILRRSFLVSTHYTRYDSNPWLFSLNLITLVAVGLAPKLPMFHRLRFKFFDAGTTPGGSFVARCSVSAKADPSFLARRTFGTANARRRSHASRRA